MEDPRHDRTGDDLEPRAPETVAGALAPPPGSRGSVVGFVAALVLLVCGVAGVLLLFTEVPAWYGVLLLVVAVLAGVVLVRRRRGAAS